MPLPGGWRGSRRNERSSGDAGSADGPHGIVREGDPGKEKRVRHPWGRRTRFELTRH